MTDTPLRSGRSHSGSLAVLGVFAFSASALLIALFTQYGLGYLPCELCLWQRVPLGLATALGLLTVLSPVPSEAKAGAAYVGILLLLVTAGVAGFHSGVEYGWWEGLPTCGGGIQELSFQDFGASLSQPAQPGCGDAPFRIVGLSMAGWNFVANIAMAGVLLWILRRRPA